MIGTPVGSARDPEAIIINEEDADFGPYEMAAGPVVPVTSHPLSVRSTT